MGGRTSPAIASRLMAEGLPSATPVVAVSKVSRSDQKHWNGTLNDLRLGRLPEDIAAPVLIGIGTVFVAQESGQATAPVTPPEIRRAGTSL